MTQQTERYGWARHLVIGLMGGAVLTVIIGLSMLENRMIDRAGQDLQWTATELAEKLDLLLFERYGDIQILADTFGALRHEKEGKEWTEHLNKVRQTYPLYAWIGILDLNGQVVAATDPATVGLNVGSADWFKDLADKPALGVHDVLRDDLSGGKDVVGFAAPIGSLSPTDRAASFHGIAVARIAAADLDAVVSRTLRQLGAKSEYRQGLEYNILSSQGRVIVESTSRQGGSVDLPALGVESARRVVSGSSGFVEEQHMRRHVPVLTGYASMPVRKELEKLGWGVLVRMDREAVLMPVHSLLWTVLIWSSVFFVPMLGGLLWAIARLREEWRQAEVAEQAIRESQTVLQAVIRGSLDAHILMDHQGMVTGWNFKAEEMFGWSSQEATGKSLADLITPPRYRYREVHEQGFKRLLTGGTGYAFCKRLEIEGWHKEGRAFPIEIAIVTIQKTSGGLLSAFIRDITEQVQHQRRQDAERRIAELLLEAPSLDEVSREIIRTICDTLEWRLGVLWKVDEQREVLCHAEEWRGDRGQYESFLEQTRQSNFALGVCLPGRVWKSGKVEWISDVTRDSNFLRITSAREESLHGAFAFPIKLGGKVQAVMEFFSEAIRPPDPRLLHLFDTVSMLISQALGRQAVERNLRRSEARFSGIVQLAEDAVITVDDSQRIVLFNHGAERIFGYAAEEVLGQSLDLLIPDRFRGAHRRHVEGFASNSTIARGRRKNGEEFPIEASIARVAVEGQTIYAAILRDISRRKEEEQALKAAKVKAEELANEKRALLSTVEAFFIQLTESEMISEWTHQAEVVFDIPAGEAIGRKFHDLSIDWNRESLSEAIDRVARTLEPIHLNKVSMDKRGNRRRYLKLALSPLRKSSGVDVVLMGEDITEHLLLEHDLAQAQKLESIGQLAAGIAHEINTPTQFIGDNVHFLSDSFTDLRAVLDRHRELLMSAKSGDCSPDLIEACETEMQRADLDYLMEEIPKAVAQTAEGVERIATIVRAMKDFAHPGSDEKGRVDFNKAIESTVAVSRNEWKYVADLTTDLAADLPPVFCLLGPINQMILNMIVNAAHAIADVMKGTGQKGRIMISSRLVDEWVEIRIADTGTGIPEEIRGKIFDPFFTTKEVGKGTGQGLAISRSIVADKHGGTIAVESEVGKGTTFIVRLPAKSGGKNQPMEEAA